MPLYHKKVYWRIIDADYVHLNTIIQPNEGRW